MAPKKIALCADGTWNRGGPGAPTNVWRIHQAIQRSDDVITAHDNGVGTGRSSWSKFLGGAFGFGLHQNVADLYAFLIRNYSEGDEVYLFGFSRGAYTVRLLSGVLQTFGIVKRSELDGQSAEEVARVVVRAFRQAHAMRYRKRHQAWLTSWGRFLLGERGHHRIAAFPDRFRERYSHGGDVCVRLLGVWDTVRAIGGPLDEVVRLMNPLFCATFADHKLASCVQEARQALAIDEPRQTFLPIPWDDDERVTQAWFAGAHSDIGGGYEKQGLAALSLAWMMEGAQDAGLDIDPNKLAAARAEGNPHGMLHDPRAAKGAFYRFRARNLSEARGATIDESVAARALVGTAGYAPGNLAPDRLTDDTEHAAPFDSVRGARNLRSYAHATIVAFLLIAGGHLAFRAAPPDPSGWIPTPAKTALEFAADAAAGLIPHAEFAEFVVTPFQVLATEARWFWTWVVALGGAAAVIAWTKRHMTRRADSTWDDFRTTGGNR